MNKSASMGKRIGAYILDALFIASLYGVYVLVLYAIAPPGDLDRSFASMEYASTCLAYRLLVMGNPIILFLYGWLTEGGKHNSTWGKRITGIIVAGKQGHKARNLDVMVRNIMKAFPPLLTAVFLNMGLFTIIAATYEIINIIVVLASKDHRGIHDRVADTVVIHKEDLSVEKVYSVEDVKITLPSPEEIKKNYDAVKENTVAPVSATVPVHSIVAVDGQYKGAEFPLDLPIKMGRDAKQCNVVFAANTEGVSKLHCEIKVVDKKVCITDLGSTYGTLINGEITLRPNEMIELNVGEEFRIGKNETYIVK